MTTKSLRFSQSIISGQEISKVKDEKDIGVVIDEELSFDKHIYEKVNKANSIFAVLRTFRNLNADIFLFMILYV
jgi:hypothetical protein